MVEFTNRTPTIAQVYNYTYKNKSTWTRFFNEERDILKTRIKIIKRTVYKKNKEGKFTTPDERLYISTTSAPQYPPFNKLKSKGALKQRKIKHTYESVYLIQNTPNGYDFWQSKMVWRVGSQKRVPNKISQSKVQTIFEETRRKLERKYSKYPPKKQKELIRRDIEHIRKRASYVSVGDFLAKVYGIMLDVYYRDYFVQKKFDCLYGRSWYNQPYSGIEYPFLDKHSISVLNFLLKRGIIKYK